MPFVKLSDDYSDDCWTLSDAAFRLHTEALVWSGRKLLDCVIPKDDLRRFAKHPEAAEELVAVGWWSQTAKTYIIRHHAGYQRTKADVLKLQARNIATVRRAVGHRSQVERPGTQITQMGFQMGTQMATQRVRIGTERIGLEEREVLSRTKNTILAHGVPRHEGSVGCPNGGCESCGVGSARVAGSSAQKTAPCHDQPDIRPTSHSSKRSLKSA